MKKTVFFFMVFGALFFLTGAVVFAQESISNPNIGTINECIRIANQTPANLFLRKDKLCNVCRLDAELQCNKTVDGKIIYNPSYSKCKTNTKDFHIYDKCMDGSFLDDKEVQIGIQAGMQVGIQSVLSGLFGGGGSVGSVIRGGDGQQPSVQPPAPDPPQPKTIQDCREEYEEEKGSCPDSIHRDTQAWCMVRLNEIRRDCFGSFSCLDRKLGNKNSQIWMQGCINGEDHRITTERNACMLTALHTFTNCRNRVHNSSGNNQRDPGQEALRRAGNRAETKKSRCMAACFLQNPDICVRGIRKPRSAIGLDQCQDDLRNARRGCVEENCS